MDAGHRPLDRLASFHRGGARRHPHASIGARSTAAERLHGVRTTTEQKSLDTQTVGSVNESVTHVPG